MMKELENIESILNKLTHKISMHSRSYLLLITIICFCSFITRMYVFPYNIPISLDAAGYFWYAMDMKIIHQLPHDYYFPNNTWPIFMSFFFSLMNSNSFLDYMNAQRLLSVIISTITIPIIFLLCNNFLDKKYTIIPLIIFAFEPRIILNSVLGITEPLFVLMISCMMLFFFQKKTYFTYAAFGAAAICAIIRYEGLLLIAPLTIGYFIKNREIKHVRRYFIALLIFVLITTSIAFLRLETTGQDGLVSHVSAGAEYYQHVANSADDGEEQILKLFELGIKNFIFNSGWISIPILWFFVPIGIIFTVKNRNPDIWIVFSLLLTLLIPLFYAYTRDIHETRYFLSLYPIFCIFSGFMIKKIMEHTNLHTLVIIIMIIGIVSSSFIFIDNKKIDTNNEMYSYEIAKILVDISHGTNDLSYVTKYYSAAVLADQEFPILKKNSVVHEPKIFQINEQESIEKYIERNRNEGLTHLVVDGKDKNEFLNHIYFEEESPYLTEYINSNIKQTNNKIKIFEINYEEFDIVQENMPEVK